MLHVVEWTIQKVSKGALWQENENNDGMTMKTIFTHTLSEKIRQI